MAIQVNIGSASSSGDLFRGHRVRVRTLQLALQLEYLGALGLHFLDLRSFEVCYLLLLILYDILHVFVIRLLPNIATSNWQSLHLVCIVEARAFFVILLLGIELEVRCRVKVFLEEVFGLDRLLLLQLSDSVLDSHEAIVDLSLQMPLFATAHLFVLEEGMSGRPGLTVVVLCVSSAGLRRLAQFKTFLTAELASDTDSFPSLWALER